MSVIEYLPSAKLLTIVGAVGFSGALVVAAQHVTKPPSPDIYASTSESAQASDWQETLRNIEAESGIKAPEAPSEAVVNDLLSAAQSENLTTKVGRTLLVTLGSAQAQGLGQDMPTQDQLIAQALSQVDAGAGAKTYTQADVVPVPQSAQSLRAYGNGVMTTLAAHPGANVHNTYLAVGTAGDTGKDDTLAALTSIGAQYSAIAQELARLSVPSTMVPLHLQLINDYASIAATYPDMRQMLKDPLRGLAAIQRYASLIDEASRVFTNIGQTFARNGILFSKGEPGEAWNAFIPT